MKATSVLKIIGWIAVGLVAAAALSLAVGLPVMWLRNWLMPALFGLPLISFWQAVGLLILCHLLFKGHYPGGHDREHKRDKAWGRFAHRVRSSMDQADQTSEATTTRP
jgi:hypothetical protein